MSARLLHIALIAPALAACGGETPHAFGGDADRGRAAIEHFECGACHVIPGVAGPRSHVGPPLEAYSRNVYVAGKFPNEPATLARWIRDAPAMAPQTAMPAFPMSDAQARDIAAYLYSLQ